MSINRETGGQAFPFEEREVDGTPYCDHLGMTLRDYFAAKYLSGYMSNPSIGFPSREHAAREAYLMADAMLAERTK